MVHTPISVPFWAISCLRDAKAFHNNFPNQEPQTPWSAGPKKAHKHLAHEQFVGHPGHRSSRPGTRTKMFMFLGFRTQHINFWPLATGRETPGRETPLHPGSHRKNLFMFMCLWLSWLKCRTCVPGTTSRAQIRWVFTSDQPDLRWPTYVGNETCAQIFLA